MIVKDRSPRFGTPPSITTLEGDVIPLLFNDGIPMLQLRYPKDMEMTNLRHIYLTGTDTWIPSRYRVRLGGSSLPVLGVWTGLIVSITIDYNG